jgi:putative phosphoribosyl transferase
MTETNPGLGLPFADRSEAGKLLAARLSTVLKPGAVVLGLPRGGVPVAFEVASALGAALDVCVVRKLGVPLQPELAMGAVAEGGVLWLDASVVRATGVSSHAIEAVTSAETRVVARQAEVFRENRPPLPLAGRPVVLVDDGVATGSCMLAALEAVRRQGAAHLVVAAPVAPQESFRVLARRAEQVIILYTPKSFVAVSQWYEDFRQTSDEEVKALLHAALRPI